MLRFSVVAMSEIWLRRDKELDNERNNNTE